MTALYIISTVFEKYFTNKMLHLTLHYEILVGLLLFTVHRRSQGFLRGVSLFFFKG